MEGENVSRVTDVTILRDYRSKCRVLFVGCATSGCPRIEESLDAQSLLSQWRSP